MSRREGTRTRIFHIDEERWLGRSLAFCRMMADLVMELHIGRALERNGYDNEDPRASDGGGGRNPPRQGEASQARKDVY